MAPVRKRGQSAYSPAIPLAHWLGQAGEARQLPLFPVLKLPDFLLRAYQLGVTFLDGLRRFLLRHGCRSFLDFGQKKSATNFRRLRFAGWELFYELFTKSLLLEMPQENLIRRLQGFVILAVSGTKPLHCGNEYIVIAALPLELL